MQKFLSISCLVILAACASAGVKVDQSKMADFHKGKTTYSQVVDQLGQPTQTMVTDSGDKIITYSYYRSQARPESFIPYVGAFVGGADTETSVVTLTFDKRDILKSYASSQGGMGAGKGFESYSQSRKADQPRQTQ